MLNMSVSKRKARLSRFGKRALLSVSERLGLSRKFEARFMQDNIQPASLVQ
jgi:hypothetical protein